MLRLRLVPTFLVALACGLVAAAPAQATQDYPHVGLYWSIHSNGQPLVDSTGVLDATVANAVTRYQQIVVDVDPLTPYRPDVLIALRARRPDIKILAYVTGHYIWYSASPDSLNHYPTRYWRTVRDLDGFLYNKQGQLFGLTNKAFADVNIAKKDANGNFVVAEALARLFHDAIIATGQWDGIFIDTFCSGILWAQAPAESIDFARAGYGSPAAFDAAWRAATDTLAEDLRTLSGPSPILVGNCIPGTKYAWFNGWMRENFPYQGGGTWYSNMWDTPGGYFADEQGYQAPRNNFIFSAASPPTSPYVAENLRRARFGLASVSLGDGVAVFGYGGRVTDQYPYWFWWYDEYAVNLASGASSTQTADTGWLGQPLGAYYQMIWAGTAPDAVSNPDFETDLSGWLFANQIPATFTRDATTAARGSASGHVHINFAGTTDWYVNLSSTGTLNATLGQTYSATFWAKASSPRTIPVIASNFTTRRNITVGTSWQQYQVAFVADYQGPTRLQFYLGLDAGDVWFDDVHFQAGATTLYRRDFQHGSVFVNPSTASLSVPLEKPFQKILGIADPATNDGSRVNSVVVAASDALFLLNVSDVIPPAAILDLHAAH